jgi:uncharacterized cupredoxin-like copper-binding protein
MQRKRSIGTAFGVGGLGLLVGLLAVTGPAFGHSNADKTHSATVVTVTAGKPSELAFKLSKVSNIPAGTVTFKVTNSGRAIHDFEICTTPVKTTAKNTCVGKVTKKLNPGQSAVLTVKLTKTGMYEYLCSVPGHAAAGMKGLIGIGVKVSATGVKTPSTTTTTSTPPPAATTTTSAPPATTTTATPPPAGGGNADGCPAGTTIQSQDAALGGDHDQDDSTPTADDLDGCI